MSAEIAMQLNTAKFNGRTRPEGADGGHRPPLQQTMDVPMHRFRLTRLPRIFVDVPVIFVTTCTHQRQRLLANAELHFAFHEFAGRATDHGMFVGQYVLMPDHLHLFLSVATTASSLSVWMKSMKNALSKVLRQQHAPSPHWQKGFFDHVLRSEESLAEKWLYVSQNPVRAGLNQQPDDWPFQGEIHVLEHR